jgi:hypothetical protein
MTNTIDSNYKSKNQTMNPLRMAYSQYPTSKAIMDITQECFNSMNRENTDSPITGKDQLNQAEPALKK